MKTMLLLKDFETKVDDDIYDKITHVKWHLKRGYVSRNIWGKAEKRNIGIELLHRYIMGVTDRSICVDHINGDKLDNQRSNLRLCSQTQNKWNSKKGKGKNKYKGVQPIKSRRNPWAAFIRENKNIHYLGVFPTEELAAQAYNDAAVKYHGEFANLNVIKQTFT